MSKPSRDWVLYAVLLFPAAAFAADEATTIFRCEGARGVVTYSNSPCPTGTRPVRVVEREPSLAIAEPADKSPASPATAGKIAPTKRARFDPWLENQRLNEQIAQQRRACSELDRRIALLGRELGAALPGRAASAELDLRRAQDEYQLHCAKR